MSTPASQRVSITPAFRHIAAALALVCGCLPSTRAGEPGKLTREVWNNVTGSAVSNLSDLPRFHGGPDAVSLVSGAVAPSNAGDNYGSRLRGYVTAPVTGDYTFWESGDDAVELWFSGNTDKFAAELMAWHTSWTSPQQWDKFATQQTPTLRLVAGQKCYVELRHKEGTGGDHLALAWAYQEVHAGINLARLPGVSASQSSTYPGGFAANAIDGNTGGVTAAGDPISHTNNQVGAWWQVDLGTTRSVDRLVLWNRSTWQNRLANFRVSLLDAEGGVMLARDFFTDGTNAGEQVEWLLEGAMNARTVKVEKIGPDASGSNFICLAEVEVFGVEAPQPLVNLARLSGVTASQSSTYPGGAAANAIDGKTGGVTAAGDTISHTNNQAGAWWKADLGQERSVESLVLWNRSTWRPRLANFRVSLLDGAGMAVKSQDFFTDGTNAGEKMVWDLNGATRAQTVKVEKLGPDIYGTNFICLAEVEVYGSEDRLAHVSRQPVAAAALGSYDIDPRDLDDDDLLDSWELSYGFDPVTWQDGVRAFGADSDRDCLSNYDESRRGLDPFQPDSIQGFLTLEQRMDIPYYSIPEAAANCDKIYQQADRTFLVPGSTTGEFALWYFAQRMRGYVVAPETGNYRFWISATNGARLLISTGEDKFHKRLIAEMGPELGTGHGTNFNDAAKWDLFVCQMSGEIRLEAGKKYFIEVVHQHGHGNYPHADIAWARPNAGREEIPAEFLYSYFPMAADADDDSLPDTWETSFGLSATDNGLTDRAREGEGGDFDSDGLTNLEEFQRGTNPALADSDGDGLSDGDEVRTYGTDPTVSDATAEQLAGTVPPASVAGLGQGWIATAGGVLTSSFRGRGTWNFTVPTDGFWVLQVETSPHGNLGAEDTVPVEVGIDGRVVARDGIVFRNRQPGSLQVVTPYLSAGGHQLELLIDNYTARISVEVTAIKVLRPGGLDTDGDGRSDLIESRLATLNRVSALAVVETHVSPVFIEGIARVPEAVELRAVSAGPGSTIRHKDSFWTAETAAISSAANQLAASLAATPVAARAAAGSTQPVLPGPGHATWFARLPLVPNQAVSYTAFFENGALADAGVVVWRPLNLIGATETTIPAGSDLLLGAWDEETDNSVLEFTIGTETRSLRAKNALPWRFDVPGDYPVSVIHEKSGATYTLTVHVRGASLPDDLAVTEQRYHSVSLPGVDPGFILDAADAIGFDRFGPAATGTGSVTRLLGRAPGVHRLAARLGDHGPILDVAEVTVTGLSDALRNMSDVATPLGDGLYLVRSPLLVTHLPPGGTVRITIFAGGVTFSDGTTVKTLTAADFDENGVLMLEFIMPEGRIGAPCHYIEIFDAAGRKIHTA